MKGVSKLLTGTVYIYVYKNINKTLINACNH